MNSKLHFEFAYNNQKEIRSLNYAKKKVDMTQGECAPPADYTNIRQMLGSDLRNSIYFV